MFAIRSYRLASKQPGRRVGLESDTYTAACDLKVTASMSATWLHPDPEDMLSFVESTQTRRTTSVLQVSVQLTVNVNGM